VRGLGGEKRGVLIVYSPFPPVCYTRINGFITMRAEEYSQLLSSASALIWTYLLPSGIINLKKVFKLF
jgi:hypothetical protein